MEDYKNRSSALGRSNMAMATAYQAVNVAVLAIIVFGKIAEADDSSIKRLVAFTAVITAITAWMFSSNGLRIAENAAQDMTAAEAATAAGKNGAGQPWKIYQLYTLAITVASIVLTLTTIY
jgi:hypothetical protein